MHHNVDNLTLQPALYRNQSIAFRLLEEDGDPYGTLTTYIEHAILASDEICVPSWNLQPQILAGFLASGRFVDTGRVVPTGYVEAPVWRVTCPDLLAAIAELRSEAS